ncbi:MAG: type II toxin-antitoxin system PemK/MazF family toxin [Planctomycetaceae bacterium]|nr:type II toxin-antitoxin system PemK/MazF family toxin [Planctomycetales bacterium]MCB9920890.1 type II toxin-antitoxin system PemK/MazF family toxin [Planctomycetaceae bacterium]
MPETGSYPLRGEVWHVSFDPSVGAEIKKIRPSVVLSENAIGKLPLRIVVPITDWKDSFEKYPWFVKIDLNPTNGLTKASGADAFQVKSLSTNRFVKKLGSLTDSQLDNIASAIALCVGTPV